MSDLLEFRHLKYIVAVAEAANFTRAAERLFLAQPSLSKQIKDLEDEIGFPIFDRTRDGVRSTPSGQLVINYAQETLISRIEIIKMARAVYRGEIPPLKLGFSSFINPRLLQSFRNSYAGLFPGSQICLSGGDPIHVLERLEQGTLDCALLPMPIDGPMWMVQQLAQSPLVVCMRSDDPLANESSLHIHQVASRLKIFRDPRLHPAAHRRLVEMFAELGESVDVACSVATPTDIQWMVRDGYGLALIDQDSALETGLTTRHISGVRWTADSAFVHHAQAAHLAIPFVMRLLQGSLRHPARRRFPLEREQQPIQLDLLA